MPLYLVAFVNYGFSPKATDVGYQPVQPVPYSHAIHAGQLGMDCRYCHVSVEVAAHAAIPPTQTCMNCHATIHPNKGVAGKDKLAPILESYETGKPVEWVRVHDLSDFAYFNHSAHVGRGDVGIGCVSCHGRVDRMEVVYQHEPLSMSWCLDCHRAPEAHLRPREFVTQMDWKPEGDAVAYGAKLRQQHNVNPSTDCSTCHR